MHFKNTFESIQSLIKNEILLDGRVFDFNLPEGFLDWFVENGTFFDQTHFEIPETTIIKNTKVGNCFHNSQLVSLQNDKISYFEGVIKGTANKYIIHHGFNLLNNKILDVTHLRNMDSFITESGNETFSYFGMKIDDNFIENNSPDILTSKYLNNPLILKYYEDKC